MTGTDGRRERRLRALKQAGGLSDLNGIEYIEVRDTAEPVTALRQRTLYVRLVRPPQPPLDKDNVLIDGGERFPEIDVEWAAQGTDPGVPAELLRGIDAPDHILVVRTASRGDFSRYRLRLVAEKGSPQPAPGFDPLLAEAGFRFKAECPSDFDCAPDDTCPPEPHTAPTAPTIDYLAKDYQGFRRLMLDRMALLAPEWTERNPADVGVALVELLAYAADGLSYRQDAVATEAYLGTARSRVSLRRHARLVDYRVHEGCNARVWARVEIAPDAGAVTLPAGTALLTRLPGHGPRIEPGSPQHRAALSARPVVFETVAAAVLHPDLAELRLYTWGDPDACLPRGATAATLRGAHPRLRAGDVLVLAETVSPTTGQDADADPDKRWAVRLTGVRTSADPAGGLFEEPQSPAPVEVTEISWPEADSLPFPLRLGVADGDLETARAWGNIVLADHGLTVPGEGAESLGTVPAPRLVRAGEPGPCGAAEPQPVPVRYRPGLAHGPLTHAAAAPFTELFTTTATAELLAHLNALTYGDPLASLLRTHGLSLPAESTTVRGTEPLWSIGDGVSVVHVLLDAGELRVSARPRPASDTRTARPREAHPAIRLIGDLGGQPTTWQTEPDLLNSSASAPEFTVETEHDGAVRLRFGDDEHGLRPKEGTVFRARYRIGNGRAGNIGAESLAHAVTAVSAVTGVDNPLSATGGTDPETAEEIRRDAPEAFAVQERAVTEADWAEVTARSGTVQRAAATFRWTGSWHTVFVTADRVGGRPVDSRFEGELRTWLERYRPAGYDLEVDGPVFVPLEIGLHVCVDPAHRGSDVGRAVLARLSDSVLPDGSRGLFHPDRLTFGQDVHLSAVQAAVHAVTGVESVDVHTFQRLRRPESSGLEAGVLPMGRLEIARLDNDPNFPERGVLALTLGGGR